MQSIAQEKEKFGQLQDLTVQNYVTLEVLELLLTN